MPGEAATEAFSRYLSDTTYSAHQIHFVELIVAHLTDNGVVEAARLYESPFTDSAAHGPEMIFAEDEIGDLLAILAEVRNRALPDVTVA